MPIKFVKKSVPQEELPSSTSPPWEVPSLPSGMSAVMVQQETAKVQQAIESMQQMVHDLSEIELVTTEYIHLYKKLESIGGKKLLGRMEEIRKNLQTIANQEVEDYAHAIFDSPQGKLAFSPRVMVVEFEKPFDVFMELVSKWGMEVALSAFKISTGELKQLLSEQEIDKFATHKPGHRILKGVQVKE